MNTQSIEIINKIFSIDSLNQDMCVWALSYLKKLPFNLVRSRGYPTHPYQDVIEILLSIENDGERELILRKMKAAWKQKKLREKGDRKTCSYLITPQAQQQLAQIAAAKKLPINKTLETIIKKAYQSMGKKKTLTMASNAPIDKQRIRELFYSFHTPQDTSNAPKPDIQI